MPAPFPEDGAVVVRDCVGQELINEYREHDRIRQAAAELLMLDGNVAAFTNDIRRHRGERPVDDRHLRPVGSAVSGTH